ncbi:MAG: hypothetical protein ABSE69_19065 [Roseiarcus sp.]
MPVTIRPIAAALGIACMTLLTVPVATGGAFAQNNQAEPSQEAPKQIALTEKQIESVLAAKPDIDAIVNKLPQGAQPSPKVMAQLDGAAKKHGFASYADYDDVAGNISMVMEGFDPQTKKYVGQDVVIKQEIAQVQADKKMPANDKKQALSQLNDELKSVTPLQFPANVDVVAKYYDKLSEAMSGNQ